MAAILLALGASLCYGVSNFIGPLISRDLPVSAVMVSGQAIAFLASATIVLVTAAPAPDGAALAAGLAAGAGNAAGLAAFYRAASVGPLSIVAPIGSTGAALPVIVGLARGEPVGEAGLAGILLAVSGVAMASRRREADRREHEDLPQALLLSIVSAMAFGVFLWGMAPAAEDGVFWAVAISRASLLTLLVAGVLVLGAEFRVRAADLPKVALPGVLLFCGTVLYSSATREGLLSVVSVVGSLFPVVTVGLALAVLRERLSPVQRAGVAATLAGVVLLSL